MKKVKKRIRTEITFKSKSDKAIFVKAKKSIFKKLGIK